MINTVVIMMKKARRTKKNGLSLIEVLVALAVFSAVMAAATGVFVSVHQAWRKQKNTVEIIQRARWAMEFMTNEIRHAQTDDSGGGKDHPKDSDKGRALVFGFDTNFNGNVDTQIQYALDTDSQTIQRCTRGVIAHGGGKKGGGGWLNCEDLITHVVTSDPGGKNPSGNPIFDATNDGFVVIELTFRPDLSLPEGTGNRNFTLRSAVRTRNE